jgi:phosphatidylglycerol lysyltransferase
MIPFLKRWSLRALPVLLLAAAAWVLWRELRVVSWSQVSGEALAWGPARIAAAAGLTAVSFALLALAEWLGLRWAGARVPFRCVLLGSFCANAFAHSIGLAVVVGGAVRFRLYGKHGASLWAVGQTSVYCTAVFGLGVMLLAGLCLIVAGQPALATLPIPPLAAQGAGWALLAAVLAYVGACAVWRRPIRLAGHELALPSWPSALAQAGIGLADAAATALLVWLLLPPGSVSYPAFASAYVLATVAGVASAAPGGVGVFEGAMLALSPGLTRAPLAAALLGYRLIYYVAPLVIAAALLARSGAGRRTLDRAMAVWRGLAPAVLSVAAFAIGAVLILTGVGRIAPGRLAVLQENVPVVVLETSHMLSLISGLALMASALGLLRGRTRAAPLAALAAGLGASTALLRGLDVGPAAAAALFAGAALASRPAFQRKGAWKSDHLIPVWALGVVAVLLGAMALGLWVYDDTPYETRLWIDVGYPADPSRFLRSLALFGGALLAFGAWVLARGVGPTARLASAAEIEAVRPLVEAQGDTNARLALIGDKALLAAEDGSAFIMYAAEGRSLIAMGDPVGAPQAGGALLWRFKELAYSLDARMVIYHASPRFLTGYLDLGLSLVKLGEEAHVPLNDFSLEGSHRRNLRQGHAKAVREHLSFEVVHPPIEPDRLAALRHISDAWLLEHGGHEKGFSLGRFDPAILSREPIALVRREGEIVAFANIWTGGREEVSIDLMRHTPDAPRGTMDYLFVELMVWARAEGFSTFNLGMAPLAGLAEHPLAPLWHKLGGGVARHGSRFYGFEGLRAFKAKFDPVWAPRYLAAPPGGLVPSMIDVTRLIGRARSS